MLGWALLGLTASATRTCRCSSLSSAISSDRRSGVHRGACFRFATRAWCPMHSPLTREEAAIICKETCSCLLPVHRGHKKQGKRKKRPVVSPLVRATEVPHLTHDHAPDPACDHLMSLKLQRLPILN